MSERPMFFLPSGVFLEEVEQRPVAKLKDQVELPLPPEDLQQVDQVPVFQGLEHDQDH